jgi:hypothetical protein
MSTDHLFAKREVSTVVNLRIYALAGAIVLAGCAAGGLRPAFAPLTNAATLEVSATPAQVIGAVQAELLKEQGMQVQWVSETEGYLETQWYNVQTRATGNISTGALDQNVRFRFWVDMAAEGTSKVTAEAVWMRGWDPSRTEREQESMVPDAHPGGQILSRVLGVLRQEFGA